MAQMNVLRDIAEGLSGREIAVGTTCSGLETGIMCAEALWDAINARFSTQVRVVGKFAVERNPDKQQFILKAHKDKVQHLFSDVACFEKGEAWRLKTKQMVAIPRVFLLMAGVSCIDISSENIRRKQYANCYSDASGSSGSTYELGYKQALKCTKASVSLYENVIDAAKSIKDVHGEPQMPAVEIATEDLARLGHAFEYVKVDTADYLLPQRRNRVWGSSCLGEDAETFSLRMRMSAQRMQSTTRFPLDGFLDPDLPRAKLTSDTNKKHLKVIKGVCTRKGFKASEMTMDTRASESRGPEFAGPGLLTCCRPTHPIFHLGLERLVTGQEMLAAQGVWPESSCASNFCFEDFT